MDSAKLNDWLQVVGLFGVIASLLFVGLQMKQDREITLSSISQARTEATMQTINDHASNPYWMAAMAKVRTGNQASLTPEEQLALGMYGSAALYNFENLHLQYELGFVDHDHWLKARDTLKDIFSRGDGTRAEFERAPENWRTSFRQAAFDIIAEIDEEAASQ